MERIISELENARNDGYKNDKVSEEHLKIALDEHAKANLKMKPNMTLVSVSLKHRHTKCSRSFASWRRFTKAERTMTSKIILN